MEEEIGYDHKIDCQTAVDMAEKIGFDHKIDCYMALLDILDEV